MKTLLTATAVIEVGAGLALADCPSAAVALLLGSSLDTPATLTLGRIAGAAMAAAFEQIPPVPPFARNPPSAPLW